MLLVATIISFSIIFELDILPNEYTWDIDIDSGQLRSRSLTLGLIVNERIFDTNFSNLVKKFSLIKKNRPNWHTTSSVHTNAFVKRYGYYKYTQAPNLCDDLARYVDLNNISLNEKKLIIAEFLQFLQMGDVEKMEEQLTNLRATFQLETENKINK